MPRRASRLTLELTDVRTERLQDISEEDAQSEGMPLTTAEYTFRKYFRDDAERAAERLKRFADFWKSLHGAGSWESNPWVWVLSFRLHHVNIDRFLKTREAAA